MQSINASRSFSLFFFADAFIAHKLSYNLKKCLFFFSLPHFLTAKTLIITSEVSSYHHWLGLIPGIHLNISEVTNTAIQIKQGSTSLRVHLCERFWKFKWKRPWATSAWEQITISSTGNMHASQTNAVREIGGWDGRGRPQRVNDERNRFTIHSWRPYVQVEHIVPETRWEYKKASTTHHRTNISLCARKFKETSF